MPRQKIKIYCSENKFTVRSISFSCTFISVMNTILASDFKSKNSKWLYVVVLLLSFFTISGVVLKPQARLYVHRTTLVANPPTGFVRSINYKRALLEVYNNCSAHLIFTISTFAISRIYSRQICTCINYLAMAYDCRPKTTFFLRAKTFPQNSDDYSAIPLG